MRCKEMFRRGAASLFAVALGLVTVAVHAEDKKPLGGVSKNALLYVALNVNDYQKSHDYYTKVIGLKLIGSNGPGVGKFFKVEASYSFSGTSDEPFILLQQLIDHDGPYTVGDGFARIKFKVEDALAIVKRQKEAGYKFIIGPCLSGSGRVTVSLEDPDGYAVSVFQDEVAQSSEAKKLPVCTPPNKRS